MAAAVGKAPDNYRDNTKIAGNLAALSGYLSSHYAAQPLLNKIVALWAAHWFLNVMTVAERRQLLADLYQRQRGDGGWSLTDPGTWEHVDRSPLETRPDGYATGLTVLVPEEAVGKDPQLKTQAEAHCARGIRWRIANQYKTTGAWPARSLNKSRAPETNVGKSVSDAAMSYAVLALEARR
jgi:squalene-hopene/tetraprenyl-beta-curcumene cyclase